MKRTPTPALLALAVGVVILLAAGGAAPAFAQDSSWKQPPYTTPEYNAYTAAISEKTPALQLRGLDDFVQKYPGSGLLNFVYRSYIQIYLGLKNYPKAIEYADKLLGLGEKADPTQRYEAYFWRALAFNNINLPPNDPGTREAALKAREAALAGLKALADLKKPDNVSAEDFQKQTTLGKIQLNYAAATAAMLAKDYPGAVESYKAILALTPNEPVPWFRLGLTYMAMNKQLDAFWVMGRAASLRGPDEAKVKKYLRQEMLKYQQTSCENLLDAELNELIALAGSSADRPDSYKFPSSADLDAARKDMTIASVVTDLKAGGEKSKVTWLAACGLEFPEVPGKLLGITAGTDAITLKVAFVTSEEQFNAATTPDMEVKVVGQPEAARLEKDNPLHFTAILASYDPDPSFLLHWDKGKVNAQDIPQEKKAPAKKAPAKKAPAKKRPR